MIATSNILYVAAGIFVINVLLAAVLVLRRLVLVRRDRRFEQLRSTIGSELLNAALGYGDAELRAVTGAARTERERRAIVSAIIDQVGMLDAAAHKRVVTSLKAAGVLSLLEHRLESSHQGRSTEAAIALGRLTDPQSIAPLLRVALSTAAPARRIAAVRALGRMGSTDAALGVVEALREGRVPGRVAAESLVRLGRHATALAIGLFESSDANLRWMACIVVASTRRDELPVDLVELERTLGRILVSDPVPRVRQAAVQAIGIAGSTISFEVLQDGIDDQDAGVRAAACDSARVLGATTCLPQITRALTMELAAAAPDLSVARNAARAIAVLAPDTKHSSSFVSEARARIRLELL